MLFMLKHLTELLPDTIIINIFNLEMNKCIASLQAK